MNPKIEPTINKLEISSPSEVRGAARNLAAALSETPQFKAYEEYSILLDQDIAAQKAIQSFQEKQQALQALLILQAVPSQDAAELERLQQAWLAHDSVKTYLQSQGELLTLCQTLGDLVSEQIGLNYSAACGVSCCG